MYVARYRGIIYCITWQIIFTQTRAWYRIKKRIISRWWYIVYVAAARAQKRIARLAIGFGLLMVFGTTLVSRVSSLVVPQLKRCTCDVTALYRAKYPTL